MEMGNRILGKTVYLRPITREDTDLIINWRNSDTVRPYFIYQEPFTREGHEKWLRDMIDSGNGYQFIVCKNDTDDPIGCTYLRDYDRVNKKIEYGVFLGSEEVKGQGIGTEILQLTLSFAFEQLQLHKVFARAFADNPASVKSFLKGGFQQEAYLKEEVWINGEYRDIVFLAILDSQYQFMKDRIHEKD